MATGKTRSTGRPGRPRNADLENREATTRRILDAALDLFSARSFDATSTATLARHAGIAQSVLHYHFKTKELLWQATIRDLFRRINADFPFPDEPDDDTDFEGLLRLAIERHMKVTGVYPEMARIIIIEGSLDTDRLTWLIDVFLRATFKNFDRILDGARSRRLIADIPNHLLSNIIYSAGSVLFSIAPLISRTYGIDVTNLHQRTLAIDAILEILMNGMLNAGADRRD